MAKRMVRAIREGWNHVTDLHFLIGDYHLVDE